MKRPSLGRPPAWVRALLWLAAPPARRADVLGDLEEVHATRRVRHGAARAWLLSSADALLCAAALGMQRLGDAFRGALVEGRTVMKGWLSLTEIRTGARLLARHPVMTVASVLALAVGFALAIVGFVLLDSAFFSRLPFDGGERWVRVEARRPPTLEVVGLEPARLEHLRRSAETFEHLGARRGGRFNLELDSGDIQPVTGTAITPETFGQLPYAPIAGRLLHVDDAAPGAAPVVVIRESLRPSIAESPARAVGETLRVGGVDRTVVGVLPDTAGFPNGGEVWLPLEAAPTGAEAMRPAPTAVFGVVRADIEPAEALAELRALSRQFDLERGAKEPLELALMGYTELGSSPTIRLLFFATVAILVCILLVVAANVANLTLARTSTRLGELAVRSALGARRSRLVAQLSLETALLGVGSAAFGLAGARFALSAFDGLIDDRPFWIRFAIAPRTMLFVAALTLIAAVVIGVVPALAATRRDPAGGLRSSSGRTTFAFGRTGQVLIVVQLGISIALLTGALVMGRGFASYLEPGYAVPRDELLTAWVYLGDEQTPTGESPTARDLVRAAAAIPGALAAGVASQLPSQDPPLVRVEVEGASTSAAGGPSQRMVPIVQASEGFLEALGANPLSGRLLSAADQLEGAPPVAVVNQPFLEDVLGGGEALGRRVRTMSISESGDPAWGPWMEVVGVVADLGLSVADPGGAGGLYVPFDGRRGFYLAVRSAERPVELAPALRRALAMLDQGIVVNHLRPLTEVEKEQRSTLLSLGTGLVALGAVALLLSLVSLYALVSFALQRQIREIGVRLALGAGVRRIVWSVVRPVATLCAGGTALGLLLAFGLLRLRGIFVFRLPPAGAESMAVVVLLLGFACALACVGPVRRAIRLRPLDALREE